MATKSDAPSGAESTGTETIESVPSAADQWGPPSKDATEASETPQAKKPRRRKKTTKKTADNSETKDQAPETETPEAAPKKKRRSRSKKTTPAEEKTQTDAPASESSDTTPRDDSQEEGKPKRKRRSRSKKADSPADANVEVKADATNENDAKPTRKQKRGHQLEVGSEEWKEIFSDKTFKSLGLRSSILKGIEEHGFTHATHIQAQLIEPIIAGKDVLGQARTGTGKTAAFGMPVIHSCKRQTPFQTIILAPTRELAIQIAAELDAIAKWTPLRIAAVYGGKKMDQQVRELETGPDIIVATPGRLIDCVERRVMHLRSVRQIVLDEVDRMLDIGFREDIKRILSMVKSNEHQTIFVSATISDEIEKLAKSFMTDAVDVRTTTGSLTVSLVKQHYISVQPWDKRPMLIHLIKKEQPELAVVFCQMKRTVDKIAMRLKDAGIDAVGIHGDLMQSKRNSIIKRLRDGDLHILVASDLAARGLDVDGITHVINFDLPEDPEIYVHRIGRTARAGRAGTAYSLVTPEQGGLLTSIEIQANAHIEPLVFDDFEPGPVPDEIHAEKKQEKERIEQAEAINRFAGPKVPAAATADPSKFPGGIVPSKMP
ncbi:MAG: DEAD/DEAH box helicase, partial [Planctomycetota bacterium]